MDASSLAAPSMCLVQSNDSIDDMDEEEYLASRDSSKMSRINRAQEEGQMNGRDYIIENRYLPVGEDFVNKHWYDHIYMMSGVGMQGIFNPQGTYDPGTLVTAHVGFGKNVSKFSSYRAYGQVGFAYRDHRPFPTAGLNLDYLYNLSSYFSGYNPTRRFNTSLFFGLGGMVSRTKQLNMSSFKFIASDYKMSANAHLGVQLQIYGGPRSYFNIEPYVGISTDQIDISGERNWHKYDLYWGVNGSYVYYLRDHITDENFKHIYSAWQYKGMTETEKLAVWRNPYFFEIAAGPTWGNTGHNITVSAGKWYSPAFGFRGSIVGRNYAYEKFQIAENIERENRAAYVGVRAEGIINPFGFGRYYNWDQKLGFYFLGGVGLGRVDRYNWLYAVKRNTLISLEGGVHMFLNLDKGVQFFVEPHISHYSGNQSVLDRNNTEINFGINFSSLNRRFRDCYTPEEMPHYSDFHSRLTLGFGIGRNLRQNRFYDNYSDVKKPLISNFTIFGEYLFNDYVSGRIGIESLSLADGSSLDNMNDEPYKGDVVWKHSSHFIFVNFDPVFHLTNLIHGVDPYRKWDVDGHFGLTASVRTGINSSIAQNFNEALQIARADYPSTDGNVRLGFNAGFKISYHFNDQISAFVMPTMYLLNNQKYASATPTAHNWSMLQTLNVGVQYAMAHHLKSSQFEDSLNIDKWRNPLFIEAHTGVMFGTADDQAGSGNTKLGMGSMTSISIGKWIAPVLGVRATLTKRMVEWGYDEHEDGTKYYNEDYLGGRLDLLINPMGIFDNFSWDDSWGVYAFVGYGFGNVRKHMDPEGTSNKYFTKNCPSTHFGLHPWVKISDDMHLFLEYMYTHTGTQRGNVLSEYKTWDFDDGNQNRHSLSLGLTMNVRSPKYRDVKDLSAMYTFKPWLSSRMRIGAAGGLTMPSSYRASGHESSFLSPIFEGYNGLVFGEYRISDYYAGRITGEYVSYSHPTFKGEKCSMVLISPTFQACISTLLGDFRPRHWELDLNVGPTVFVGGKGKEGDKSTGFGFTGGARISRKIADQLAVFAQSSAYFVSNAPGSGRFLSKFGGMNFIQTFNAGVHFTFK